MFQKQTLNPVQQKAVLATDGKVLVLAGAGSGKTTVLLHRICHLIAKGTPPEEILGLTFTNKAAKEMRERMKKLIDQKKAKKITLCTFHSFCMKLLRKEIDKLGFTKEFSIYTEADIKRVVTGISKDILEHEKDLPSIAPSLQMIAKLNSGNDQVLDPFTKELYEKLGSCMRAYNALDFDGLIEKAVQLFEKFPSLLDTYSFKYIMIDEYQDTNPMQYRLATLLSKKHGNLCVVGDDDQSIYGWRGACVKNILDFPADTTVKLEQNYRSTPLIIKASNHLIKHNETRHSKTLFTSLSSDEKIEIFHAPSERDEAEGVIDRLLYLKKTKDYKWSDFAILYRSNILARPIEASLLHRKIPYQMFGGLELFERAEIKDLISYLKWIANPKDTESLLRIINYPRRGISNQTLDLLTKDSRAQEIPLMEFIEKIFDDVDYPLTGQGRDGLKRLLILFKEAKTRFESNPLKESTEWLIEEIGYKKQIDSEAKSEKARAFKWENIQYCLKELEAYEKEEKDPTLYDFVSSTQLGSKDIQHETEKPKDKVNLMTFHSAKGLEFPVCFLIGLEDHILPHEKSLLETGIEEERRLFYVAMTRAKKTLVLSMARKRPRFGKEANSSPSRFLFEIPQETMQVSSWRLIQGKT